MKDFSAQTEYFGYLRRRGALRRFLRRLLLRPVARFFSGSVLDIGAGIGEFLDIYREAVGIDPNRDCADHCSSRGHICLNADAGHLPFRDNTFDGVLLNNVLEHLTAPDAVFSEIARVLRDGGRLLIELPGKKGWLHDTTHVRFWDAKEIVPFLEERNFQELRVYYFPIPCEYAGNIFTHNKLRVSAVFRKVPSAPNA